ncbi:MAG: FAD-dependent oxidoreductase [Clostridia bacterium]|nr:FAD-dependent oxidoreductase [Clostridia bacterium]
MNSYSYSVPADVRTHAEIVVCGGGTAGTFAAIAAAREGRKTVLIERFGALGGTSSMGLVTPTMSTHVMVDGVLRDPQNSYLTAELDKRCAEAGAGTISRTTRYHDPLLLRGVLEQMAMEAGVEIMLYTTVLDAVKDGNRVKAVIIADKEGVHTVEGDIFIDASGDGDLSVMAGAQYTAGNPKTGKNQPISLRYSVGGVDMQAFASTVTDGSIYLMDGGVAYAHCTVQDGSRQVEQIMKRAKDAGDLTPEDLAYWQVFGLASRPDTLCCNCPEIFEHVDGTKAYDLTHAQLMGKQAVMRQLAFYKKYFCGFEHAYVSEIAPMVGVRESREIITDYVLTLPEAVDYAKFPDCVAQTNYPVDIHGFGDEYSDEHAGKKESDKPWFEIPYRALVVKDIENLLVAGRPIGGDFFIEAAIRIIPTCRATGEAAGLAAALALDQGVSIHDLDGIFVHDAMIARGADFV